MRSEVGVQSRQGGILTAEPAPVSINAGERETQLPVGRQEMPGGDRPCELAMWKRGGEGLPIRAGSGLMKGRVVRTRRGRLDEESPEPTAIR